MITVLVFLFVIGVPVLFVLVAIGSVITGVRASQALHNASRKPRGDDRVR